VVLGELLDRAFQRSLLQTLAEAYPRSVEPKKFGSFEDNRVAVNLLYLQEHGLLTCKTMKVLSGEVLIAPATITARGLDFLADDGGLSAVLGVVTVRLHEDSVKALLIERVANSNEDQSVKDRVIEQIKSLPAEALSTLTMKTLESSLAQIPNIMPILQKLLFS
jgi:hypothetical protein